jgi:hypothetical protein
MKDNIAVEANHAGGTGINIMKRCQIYIPGSYKPLERGQPRTIGLIKTNEVVKRIFGPKKEEDGRRRKLHNEEHHNLCRMIEPT